MTLQQLIGELQTLALAFPSETPVLVRYKRFSEEKAEATTVIVESSSGVQIVLDGV